MRMHEGGGRGEVCVCGPSSAHVRVLCARLLLVVDGRAGGTGDKVRGSSKPPAT